MPARLVAPTERARVLHARVHSPRVNAHFLHVRACSPRVNARLLHSRVCSPRVNARLLAPTECHICFTRAFGRPDWTRVACTCARCCPDLANRIPDNPAPMLSVYGTERMVIPNELRRPGVDQLSNGFCIKNGNARGCM